LKLHHFWGSKIIPVFVQSRPVFTDSPQLCNRVNPWPKCEVTL